VVRRENAASVFLLRVSQEQRTGPPEARRPAEEEERLAGLRLPVQLVHGHRADGPPRPSRTPLGLRETPGLKRTWFYIETV